jgi:hypothetical protein
MIDAELYIVGWSGTSCFNKDCKHNPEYHDRIINTYYLKQGKTCLSICGELYCYDCIDDEYQKLKPSSR